MYKGIIPYDIEKEKLRIQNLPYKLNKHITNLLDFFKYAILKKNTSVVILIDGRSGFGKTTLSNQIANYCDINGYSIKKLHFNPETFLSEKDNKIGLSNCKGGDVIVFDEAMIISSRSSMSVINKMVVQAMSMMRSKRIIVIFNINSIFDLDRNLVLSRADVLLSVYGENIIDRGNVMAFFKGLDGRDRLKELYLRGKKFYDYSQPKSNFNTHFPSHFVLNEDEYEVEKQKSINEFLESATKKPSKSYLKYIKLTKTLLAWIKKNHKLSHKELGEISDLTYEQIKELFRNKDN